MDSVSSGLGDDPSLVNFDSFVNRHPNIFNKLSGQKPPSGKLSV